MKVFLSWSGKPSLQAATIFRDLLPCMNQDLSPFLSQHDVESGARWSLRIAEELDTTEYGILFLTPKNVSSPWLLFEAGALTKHLAGRACGLLFGGLSPRDISGPLSQFQHRTFGRDGVFQLFTDISTQCASTLEEHQAIRIAEKWWPDIEAGIADISFDVADTQVADASRDEATILEEILTRIRTLEHSTLERTEGATTCKRRQG